MCDVYVEARLSIQHYEFQFQFVQFRTYVIAGIIQQLCAVIPYTVNNIYNCKSSNNAVSRYTA